MNSWTPNQQNNMQMGGSNFTAYNPQFNTYRPNLPVYSAAPIHGREAAYAFPMGPNSEIYLPDADNDIIWWIRTDHVGNKSVNGFNVTARVEQSEVSMNDILKRLTALEDRINVKSNKSNAKRNGDAAVVPATTAEQVN